jgi:general secretion pathway protein K
MISLNSLATRKLRLPQGGRRISKPNSQQGMALIIVLFTIALTVILAVEMSQRLQLQIHRTTNLTGSRQAYWYAVGAEELVKQQLKRINSEKDKRSTHIHSGQDWAQQGLEFPVDGGTIGGELTDLQACFNLNSLANDKPVESGSATREGGSITAGGTGLQKTDDKADQKSSPKSKGSGSSLGKDAAQSPERRRGVSYSMEVFQRLLTQLEIDEISDVPPEYLMQRLKDWIDQDGQQTGGGGMEEDDYRGLEVPYLAANSLMASVSELRMVGGFNPAIIAKIKPYVCVIPGNSMLKININTLDSEQGELLSAMIKGLTLNDAQAIISGGQPDGYEKVTDFWERSELNQVDEKAKQEAIKYFDVTTQYFGLRAQSSFGDSKFYLNSKLHINESKQVTVIARRFGVDL